MAGLAAALLAAGCESTPSRPTYAQPPDLTTETAATVIGSKEESANPFVPDLRAYISLIDGALTMLGQFGWDRPVLIAPGTHQVWLSMTRSNRGLHAETTVTLEAGKKYTVRALVIDRATAAVWLEEEGTARQLGRTNAALGTYGPSMPPIVITR